MRNPNHLTRHAAHYQPVAEIYFTDISLLYLQLNTRGTLDTYFSLFWASGYILKTGFINFILITQFSPDRQLERIEIETKKCLKDENENS